MLFSNGSFMPVALHGMHNSINVYFSVALLKGKNGFL
jgi:hypothetical protein